MTLALNPKSLVAGHSPLLQVQLSEAATVKILLAVKQKTGKKVRWVTVATVTKSAKAGANQIQITAKKLAAGKYRVTVTATGSAGKTAKSTKTFKVTAS